MEVLDIRLDSVLKPLVDRLVQSFQPEKVYLFGSVARGEAGPDSDYDILVIVSSSTEPRYRRAEKAQKALWGLEQGADVLVLTRSEFDEASSVICSLPATVLREGKELYAA
jgi:predicted nucleotidyltransferase